MYSRFLHYKQRRDPMAMTKIDIIQNISDKLEVSMRDSTQLVESVLTIMKEQLCKGDTGKISGFAISL